MKTINMGLENTELYSGCEIKEIGGRLTLTTAVAEAVNIVGRNAKKIVDATPAIERSEVTLTGAMAVWAYLVVVHQVMHPFGKVYYDDGRTGPVLIAQH